MDSNFRVIDKYYPANGYDIDDHEFLLLADGRAFMIANEFQIVDMTVYNPAYSPAASVRGAVIQEFDANHNLIFEWRSFDHIAITEALHENLAFGTIDAVHMNALEVDNDGNLLTSSRHLDQINKIDLTTGNFIWRLGGIMNQFTWVNEPEPFTYQHDVRRLANGDITIFDNGNFHNIKHTTAKEYQLDEVNHVATLVWSYSPPNATGGHYFYHAMGNIQRLSNGNTFINWGWRPLNPIDQPSMTEVTSTGNVVWELKLEVPDNLVCYRAYKYVYDACARVSLSTMKAKNVTDNSAKLTWNPAWQAERYKVQYKKAPGASWITTYVNAPTTKLNLQSLSSDSKYKWRIQTWCDTSGIKTSGFTTQKSFTTSPMKLILNSQEISSLSIYPDPAHDVVTISSNGNISSVQLLNLEGQQVRSVITKRGGLIHEVQLSLSSFTAGNYFVQVTSDEGSEVKKLVIQ